MVLFPVWWTDKAGWRKANVWVEGARGSSAAGCVRLLTN